ncbi:MAG: sigma 54-interacting transcriptional regulator, partial [Erysipelotrichaceae bacterium]|nr:sigma 54-interacting transcriptional regulator [Erysipelotrichaceae bacterium]
MLRSEKVQECVRKYTEEMLYDGRIDAEGIDAGAVSLMTKIGRTNVSKELNSLWKNGQLIKFQGRPVFFLDYLTIKKEYPAQYIPLLIPQGSKISDYLKADGQKEKPEPADKNPLDNIIGYRDGTLSRVVDDVVAAIAYKGKGIPVLIEGDRGIRKRNFVSSVFEYTRLNGLKNEDARLIFINCQEYAEAEDRFLARILGSGDEKGAFELANKGLIYFQNIHYLPYACIAPIVDAITFGYYSKVGEIR